MKPNTRQQQNQLLNAQYFGQIFGIQSNRWSIWLNIYKGTSLFEEAQETARNIDTIVLNTRAVDGVGESLIVKDARLVADVEDFTHNWTSELGVALDRDESLWRVESLDGANICVSQRLGARRVRSDDVPVHLVDALEGVSFHTMMVEFVLHLICDEEETGNRMGRLPSCPAERSPFPWV